MSTIAPRSTRETVSDAFSGRQRLAWLLLLGSFLICAGVAVFTPLAINRYVRTATRPIVIEAVANQGTVGLFHPETGTRALFAGDPTSTVAAGSQVLTNATDSALLVAYTPARDRILGRVQAYGNTGLTILSANAPRFGAGSVEQQLHLNLPGGRIRLSVPADGEPAMRVTITTPNGEITVAEPGQYSVTVNNAATELAVQQGAATVTAAGTALPLVADQRAAVPAGGPPAGPLATERNLLRNAGFGNGLDDWIALDWNVERPDQPAGLLEVRSTVGEPTLSMRRDGVGHADVAIRQIVDADVTDFQQLKVVLGMRILWQSLSVCGNRGSECPLTISLDYEDSNGAVREWRQGFYALGNFAFDAPDLCVSCPPPRNPHTHVTLGQLNFYESENLLERLRQQDIDVRFVRNVSIIAAGHAFDVEVVDLALLAQE